MIGTFINQSSETIKAVDLSHTSFFKTGGRQRVCFWWVAKAVWLLRLFGSIKRMTPIMRACGRKR